MDHIHAFHIHPQIGLIHTHTHTRCTCIRTYNIIDTLLYDTFIHSLSLSESENFTQHITYTLYNQNQSNLMLNKHDTKIRSNTGRAQKEANREVYCSDHVVSLISTTTDKMQSSIEQKNEKIRLQNQSLHWEEYISYISHDPIHPSKPFKAFISTQPC